MLARYTVINTHKKRKMLYSHGLTVATASSDDDVMLVISYYTGVDEVGQWLMVDVYI